VTKAETLSDASDVCDADVFASRRALRSGKARISRVDARLGVIEAGHAVLAT
jgi:hypothetical protein